MRRDCACERFGRIRQVDREMISRGYRVFPPGFLHMRRLTERGRSLSLRLTKLGIEVIEVHPRSALKALGLRREDILRAFLESGFVDNEKLALLNRDNDLFDSLLSALVALLYTLGMFEKIESEDGEIILPRLSSSERSR